MTPPTEVAPPEIYLVLERISIFTPCSPLLKRYGVNKVLSRINGTRWAAVMAEICRQSNFSCFIQEPIGSCPQALISIVAMVFDVFLYLSKGIGLDFHLVIVKTSKNFIDFTQDKKNRKSVFESWNPISISRNKIDRFWKSIVCYVIRQSELFFFCLVKINKKGVGIRFIPRLKHLGFLSPTSINFIHCQEIL